MGQPAHHLHPRLRCRALGGQPGDGRRLAGLPRLGRAAACRVGDLEISEPRIYYGEIGTDYTLVRTTEREFDYPGAANDVFTKYKGSGGIPIALPPRLAFAWRFGTIKFFTSNAIDRREPGHHAQQHPRAAERSGAVPEHDKDPYMVIADGRLIWIVDSYTTTTAIPTATPRARSTTSATRSKWSSTRTTAPWTSTSSTRRTRCSRPTGASSPAC